MARLLIDEALPRALARRLRAAGYEAEDVRDLGLRGQSDERIFQEAQQQSAILITPDRDFTNILRFPPQAHRGLIFLRLPNHLSVEQLVDRVLRGLQEVSLESLARTVVVIEPNRTRIRRFD